jgi:hypothetical protein
VASKRRRTLERELIERGFNGVFTVESA